VGKAAEKSQYRLGRGILGGFSSGRLDGLAPRVQEESAEAFMISFRAVGGQCWLSHNTRRYAVAFAQQDEKDICSGTPEGG